MTLNDVKLNQVVRVVNVNCDDFLKQRFSDLGLINSTTISPIFVSPLGDPIAYEFRGNIIAIRNNDAKNIEVTY